MIQRNWTKQVDLELSELLYLALGVFNSAATVEKSLVVPQKVKITC